LKSPPFDSALQALLEELHRDYKLAVVTSSGRVEIEPLLQAAGLRGYFDTMVCDREAGGLKPAPDPYLMAARVLGAKSPLVVEDSPAGSAAGRAAGFEVLAVKSPGEVPYAIRERLKGGGRVTGE
jgi:HAD superfamily hydrolase (TIGR01509 family)